jgi:hypothetical protein
VTTVPFTQSASVQLNGAGAGTASIGPLSAREVWHPILASVSVSTRTAEALCTLYVGDIVAPQFLRETTFTGSSGDSTDRVAGAVKCGQKIWAVWTGGDPLSPATLTVTGSKDI